MVATGQWSVRAHDTALTCAAWMFTCSGTSRCSSTAPAPLRACMQIYDCHHAGHAPDMPAIARRLAATRSMSSLDAARLVGILAEVPVLRVCAPHDDDAVLTCGSAFRSTIRPMLLSQKTGGRRGEHDAETFHQGPEGWRRMTAVPVGPGICRRYWRSTPLSVSAARSMSALASEPTCALALRCLSVYRQHLVLKT